MPFAREYCDLIHDLKANCNGRPQIPKVLPSARDSFDGLQPADRSLWRHVNFAEVFNYLRQNRQLCIPVEWQDVIPKTMHEVSGGD